MVIFFYSKLNSFLKLQAHLELLQLQAGKEHAGGVLAESKESLRRHLTRHLTRSKSSREMPYTQLYEFSISAVHDFSV